MSTPVVKSWMMSLPVVAGFSTAVLAIDAVTVVGSNISPNTNLPISAQLTKPINSGGARPVVRVFLMGKSFHKSAVACTADM